MRLAAIEPFAGVEVKKIGGINQRVREQINIEADRSLKIFGYAMPDLYMSL